MLHSLEDMRSSSSLPSDHVVLGEYQMCLFSAFMIIVYVYVYVCVCVSVCICVCVLYICEW